MGLFRILPLDFASMLAGAIARLFGPFTKAHKTAYANLQKAMPEFDDEARQLILKDMWDNLGRLIGEYPHLARPAMAKRITIEGREHIDKMRVSGQGVIVLSGHFANWEIAPLAMSLSGLPTAVVYRKANNPVAEWLSHRIRSHYTDGLYHKGRSGAVQSIKALKENRALALLVDQKMNDGSPISFFGRDAMTALAAARLAIKLQLPVLAGRVVRKRGVHFILVIEAPVYYPSESSAIKVTEGINQMLEGWIREYPAQWFWVHKRWGKVA